MSAYQKRLREKRRRAWARPSQTDEVLTYQGHGRSFQIYDCEGKIANHIRAGKVWEQSLLEHVYEESLSGIAVDVGANIGNHSLWFAAICGLDVVAFEPIKAQELTRNVELNRLTGRIQIERVALGRKPMVALHTGEGRLRAGAGALPVRTLDSHQLLNVSVIKVDVEGMEPDVLAGAEQTIRTYRPILLVEHWGEPECRSVAAVVEPWGYNLTRKFGFEKTQTVVGRWDG